MDLTLLNICFKFSFSEKSISLFDLVFIESKPYASNGL